MNEMNKNLHILLLSEWKFVYFYYEMNEIWLFYYKLNENLYFIMKWTKICVFHYEVNENLCIFHYEVNENLAKICVSHITWLVSDQITYNKNVRCPHRTYTIRIIIYAWIIWAQPFLSYLEGVGIPVRCIQYGSRIPVHA